MILRAKDRRVDALLVTAILAACLLAACAGGPASAPGVTAGDLTVENAFSRPAPAGGIGGAFLTVVNRGSTADRLVAARTPIADAVELHETVNDNGVMKMRRVAGGYEVPGNGKLELKPGGNHMMFVGLKSALAQGKDFDLTLTFEKAGDVTIKVPVRQ